MNCTQLENIQMWTVLKQIPEQLRKLNMVTFLRKTRALLVEIK